MSIGNTLLKHFWAGCWGWLISFSLFRFEKISNIIKQFKLSCSKLAAHFQSMEVPRFEPLIHIIFFFLRSATQTSLHLSTCSPPTPTSWSSSPTVRFLVKPSWSTSGNFCSVYNRLSVFVIRNARKHFEKLERDAQGTRSIQVQQVDKFVAWWKV